MVKNKKLKYLKSVSQPPTPETHILDSTVARELPVIFGFKNLDMDKTPFKCHAGNGDSLLYILNTFRLFSQLIRRQIDGYNKHCHLIPEDQVRDHNLNYLVAKAPNGKLHQLGRDRTKERIIGYFDKPINLFQVCLLDLNHNLSGE